LPSGKMPLMRSFRTVVSSKGQVVIPAELREEYGFDKGTRAVWTEEKGRLVLTPITEPSPAFAVENRTKYFNKNSLAGMWGQNLHSRGLLIEFPGGNEFPET
jgi:AbrB family looped-hinge helix DNA binding protein